MSREREVEFVFSKRKRRKKKKMSRERKYWGKKMRRERRNCQHLGFYESRVHNFFIRSWQLCKICKIRCIHRIVVLFFFLEIRTVVLCKVRKTNCNLLQSIHRWFNNGIIDHGWLLRNHLGQSICGFFMFFRLVVGASEQLLTLWINFRLS